MPDIAVILLSVLVGALLGFAIGYLWMRLRAQQSTDSDQAQTDQLNQLEREQAVMTERLKQSTEQLSEQQALATKREQERDQLRQDVSQRDEDIARLQTKLDEELKNSAEKQDFFKQSLEKLDKQFKATASELLVNTGEKLSKQQGSKLDDIIKPFRENLTRFEKEFKTAYDKETREQISLKEQIKNLSELNSQLSGEAHALANALKGDSKVRGNWGEQMLEHILQSSGLREGHEYATQASFTGEDGGRLQPDVIINLPDDKCIVVDSKVTLNSWMDFVNADTEEIRQQQMKAFTLAVHQHVKSLSGKAYHKIYDIKTLDFVLMFIPIETAFLYALQTDSSIYDEAHKLNIILVSPTTLMAVLKTIAVNWKYDRQEKNTLKIAKEAEKLLDKIHNYMDSLLKARNSLNAASNHMDTAVKRFVSGKANIKDSTDKLKQLGVKSAKKMGIEWENIEAEADELDAIEHADDDESDDETED